MRTVLSFVLSALLVLGLTACGATGTTYSAGDNDILGDESMADNAGDTLFGGKSEGNTTRSADGGNDQKGSNHNSATNNNRSDSKNDTGVRAYDSRNPANGEAQFDGPSYEEMLANGRVHDVDGDLTDNENSTW